MIQLSRFVQPQGLLIKACKAALSILVLSVFCLSTSASASEASLKQANVALEKRQFKQAQHLFKQLISKDEFNTRAQFGLAKAAFYQDHLDQAEDYIEDVLKVASDNPEHLFIAARIAAKQAQSASIFSKLGYAKDSKQYFTQALEVDSRHKPSLIGLIRFNQQAPVMAGGDKDAIPSLLDRLAEIDKRAAFSIQAPSLFDNNEIDKAVALYNAALNSPSDTDIGSFKFEFAMLLSNQGFYQQALKELLSIEFDNTSNKPDYATMWLYQIGKLAAESNSNLAKGLENMKRYAATPIVERTISDDWVNFRIAQLEFLSQGDSGELKAFKKMRAKTSDKDLKKKIKSFLKEHKIKRNS
jgi:tetratricopeptide (TPR) repeat protein